MVAALLDQADPTLPQEVQAWVAEQENVDVRVVEQARSAVNQVLEDSELKDVWEDSGSDDWKMGVEALLRRLR